MDMAFLTRAGVFFLLFFTHIDSLELAPTPLPGNLYPVKYVTVSGNMDGGLMAQIMHVTHSEYIVGVAVYTSTFYRCGVADGSDENFLRECTQLTDKKPTDQYSVENVVSDIHSYDSNHLIDSPGNMRNDYVYVYAALKNPVFGAANQLNVVAFYEKYLQSPYRIKVRVQNTAESLRVIEIPTKDEHYHTPSCGKSTFDDTVEKDCTDISAPAEALEFLLGKYYNFVNPFYPHRQYVHLGPLRSFDQTEFTADLTDHGLDDVGYYYVPTYCQPKSSYGRGRQHSYNKKPCLVHVYFHACGEGREVQGYAHVQYSNYLEIAERNNIIVIFPQILKSEKNPEGCWDFNGKLGSLQYATRKSPTVTATWRMIARVTYLPSDSRSPYSSTSHQYRAGSARKARETKVHDPNNPPPHMRI